MEGDEFENDFVNQKNRKKVEKIFSEAIKVGLDFKLGKDLGRSVLCYKDQDTIFRELIEPIPKKPKDMHKVIEEFNAKIVDGSVNFSSPHFLAFPDSGNSVAAVTGYIAYGLLNQNTLNSIHTSPTATYVEIAVINWIRELIGYDIIKNPAEVLQVGGMSVPGGTLANTIALLLARGSLIRTPWQRASTPQKNAQDVHPGRHRPLYLKGCDGMARSWG